MSQPAWANGRLGGCLRSKALRDTASPRETELAHPSGSIPSGRACDQPVAAAPCRERAGPPASARRQAVSERPGTSAKVAPTAMLAPLASATAFGGTALITNSVCFIRR
jgi:hypothetical protein